MKKLLLALFLTFATSAQAADLVTVPGCVYGERRTDGQYACTAIGRGSIQTGAGAVALPTFVVDGQTRTDDLIGFRVTPVGAFDFAGQSWSGLGNWQRSAGLWRIAGPSYGVNPVMFTYTNELLFGAPQFGSQGWRFDTGGGPLPQCTGNVAKTWCTGDNTYADPSRAIGEWSTCGAVTVGQSGWSLAALYEGKRYTIERGSIVNIHLTCAGTRLAISYHRQDDVTWFGRVLDASELSQFPIEGDPTIPPAQPEPPVEIPSPEEPPLQQCPATNGIVDGVVRDPQAYVLSLVCREPVANYRTVIRALEGDFYRFGFGIQTGSDGVPRGRIYLPTPICPNAAPTTAEERFLGVKQDERCWDQLGRFADIVQNNAQGQPSVWAYSERGPQPYQPLVKGGPGPDPLPPTDTELEAVLSVLDTHRDLFPATAPDGTVYSPHGRVAEGIERIKEQLADAVKTIDILTIANANAERKLVEEREAHIKTNDELTRVKADPCSLVKVDGARIFGIRLPPGTCKPLQ